MRVVIVAYEPNLWLAKLAEAYWRRAWPECTWPVEVVSGSGAWADVMLGWLKGQTEPFLLLLEDYVMTYIDKEALESCRRAIEKYPEIGTIRLMPLPRRPLPWRHHPTFGYHDKGKPYSMSLQGAMWKPECLRDVLKLRESAWQTELRGSKRVAKLGKWLFMGTYDWTIEYENLLARGRVNQDARKWIENNAIQYNGCKETQQRLRYRPSAGLGTGRKRRAKALRDRRRRRLRRLRNPTG